MIFLRLASPRFRRLLWPSGFWGVGVVPASHAYGYGPGGAQVFCFPVFFLSWTYFLCPFELWCFHVVLLYALCVCHKNVVIFAADIIPDFTPSGGHPTGWKYMARFSTQSWINSLCFWAPGRRNFSKHLLSSHQPVHRHCD